MLQVAENIFFFVSFTKSLNKQTMCIASTDSMLFCFFFLNEKHEKNVNVKGGMKSLKIKLKWQFTYIGFSLSACPIMVKGIFLLICLFKDKTKIYIRATEHHYQFSINAATTSDDFFFSLKLHFIADCCSIPLSKYYYQI